MDHYNFNFKGNSFPNYYHPGLRKYEKFSYGNTKNVLQPPPSLDKQVVEKKPSVDDLWVFFITDTSSRINKDEARMGNIEAHMTNMGVTVKSLEIQIGQLATSIYSQQRRKFPKGY